MLHTIANFNEPIFWFWSLLISKPHKYFHYSFFPSFFSTIYMMKIKLSWSVISIPKKFFWWCSFLTTHEFKVRRCRFDPAFMVTSFLLQQVISDLDWLWRTLYFALNLMPVCWNTSSSKILGLAWASWTYDRQLTHIQEKPNVPNLDHPSE